MELHRCGQLEKQARKYLKSGYGVFAEFVEAGGVSINRFQEATMSSCLGDARQ